MAKTLEYAKQEIFAELDKRLEDGIIEKTNADLIKKLVNNADSLDEAIQIAELGTTYKKTGFHFDKRLDKVRTEIKYLKKNEAFSFYDSESELTHKLIIGDNYNSLINILIQYKNAVDVIYIDPPYGKDNMGEFAKTNYQNAITRDNLLSMLSPRLRIAKSLMSDDGVILCSIDDRNQAYIRGLFDEIFGEQGFLFCIPRITKKGGKPTVTIQKHHDYIIAYTLSKEIIFDQLEKNLDSFELVDEYVETRGKHKVTQTLDYNSLSYSKSLDYPIELNDKTYYPGSSKIEWENRQKGNNQSYDWAWRWSKSAFDWGLENGFIVLKGDRIYTKTYSKCRKATGRNEIEYLDTKKPYSTLTFIENQYSNDNGKKELNKVFPNGEKLFKNPKPSDLIADLIKMVCTKKDAVILDFFAGSGTTGQAVLKLNRIDGVEGKRTFILCQLNEITSEAPNGIAYDVTAKRIKRIMTGKCYDGTNDFKWAKDNEPYGGSLDVYEIGEVSSFESVAGQTPFDVIDETLYGKEKFSSLKEKVEWVCTNFEITQKNIEDDEEWQRRVEDMKNAARSD